MHPQPEPISFLDGLLGYQIRRASAAILSDLAQSLGGLGLKITEASVLLLIAERPRVTQSEVARGLGIQRANMVPIVSALVEQGWIERTRADGRSQELDLTASGVEMASEVRLRVLAHEARLLPVSDAERAVLMSVLGRIWRGETPLP
jgi:DNA-binding MarR family transcriptional regulator